MATDFIRVCEHSSFSLNKNNNNNKKKARHIYPLRCRCVLACFLFLSSLPLLATSSASAFWLSDLSLFRGQLESCINSPVHGQWYPFLAPRSWWPRGTNRWHGVAWTWQDEVENKSAKWQHLCNSGQENCSILRFLLGKSTKPVETCRCIKDHCSDMCVNCAQEYKWVSKLGRAKSTNCGVQSHHVCKTKEVVSSDTSRRHHAAIILRS